MPIYERIYTIYNKLKPERKHIRAITKANIDTNEYKIGEIEPI